MRCATVAIIAALIAGCSSRRPTPPPNSTFEQLPVTGDRAHAERLGFSHCVDTSNAIRCLRDDVMLAGEGPFNGGVDLYGPHGNSGFRGLTLWHDRDQRAVYAVGRALAKQGWDVCRTGQEFRGDQEIWTKPGSAFRVSIDISYFGKRRLRVLPERHEPMGKCWY